MIFDNIYSKDEELRLEIFRSNPNKTIDELQSIFNWIRTAEQYPFLPQQKIQQENKS